jgi:hypothetical protein
MLEFIIMHPDGAYTISRQVMAGRVPGQPGSFIKLPPKQHPFSVFACYFAANEYFRAVQSPVRRPVLLCGGGSFNQKSVLPYFNSTRTQLFAVQFRPRMFE